MRVSLLARPVLRSSPLNLLDLARHNLETNLSSAILKMAGLLGGGGNNNSTQQAGKAHLNLSHSTWSPRPLPLLLPCSSSSRSGTNPLAGLLGGISNPVVGTVDNVLQPVTGVVGGVTGGLLGGGGGQQPAAPPQQQTTMTPEQLQQLQQLQQL